MEPKNTAFSLSRPEDRKVVLVIAGAGLLVLLAALFELTKGSSVEDCTALTGVRVSFVGRADPLLIPRVPFERGSIGHRGYTAPFAEITGTCESGVEGI